MAYFLHHIISFQNREVEDIIIELYRKDVEPTEIIPLIGVSFNVSYPSGEGDKLDGIITYEADLSFWVRTDTPVTYEDFIITFQDDWKIVAYNDSQVVFSGYLVPGLGESEFRDKPYQLSLKASDGLGLLRQQPLSTFDLEEFTSTHRVVDILYHIIKQTGVVLPLHIRANIYESSMEDRDVNPDTDFTAQTKLHYKSLLKSPTEFLSSFEVLEMICKEHFSFYQCHGAWVLNRFAEMYSSVGPTNWYTVYEDAPVGLQSTGILDPDSYANVGRNLKIHPLNADARISSMFPVKSAKHTFNYNVWPEIPDNNKFERGTFNLPYSGPNYAAYIVDKWEVGELTVYASPFTVTPNPGVAGYRRSTYNNFNIETERELVLRPPLFITSVIKSTSTPVNVGDKLKFGATFKTTIAETNLSLSVANIIIIPTTGTGWYSWRNTNDGRGFENKWELNSFNAISIEYSNGSLTTEPQTVSIESPSIPVDGEVFVMFQQTTDRPGQAFIWSGFELEYIPYTAGGYIPLVGDFWVTSQTDNYKDVIDEEVGLSDSPKKVFKGALYRADGLTLTTPTWYRFGYTEQRHFKELANLGVYNHLFRRHWRLTGTFGGTKFSPVSDPTKMEPLSFHKHFMFFDAPELAGRMFMLVPPLSIDYVQGNFIGNFVECLNSNFFDSVAPTKDQVIEGIIKLINTTTLAEWNSAGGAPASGTLGYPPAASKSPLGGSDDIWFYVPVAENPSFAADPNGAGNSPSLTQTSSAAITLRLVTFDVGADIAVGNRFIISIFGMQLVYTAEAKILYHDGNQTGDQHFFSYKFK